MNHFKISLKRFFVFLFSFYFSFFYQIVFSEEIPKEPSGIDATKFISLISPDNDINLISTYPIIPEKLKPWTPSYDWEGLGVPSMKDWSFDLSPDGIKVFQKAASQFEEEIQKSDTPLREEKYYLKADLLLTIALNTGASGDESEKESAFQKAKKAYQEAIQEYPQSPYRIQASYHLGLIALQEHDYPETIRISHLRENLWKKDIKLALPFYSLFMEAYYLRGRYLRSEDFLWDISTLINREDLNSHLGLRYGDSLFWQKHFKEAADWYQKMEVFLLQPTSLASKTSRLYYAESLFQMGDYAKARSHFEAYQLTMGNRENDSTFHVIQFRILQCRLGENGFSQDVMDEIKILANSEQKPASADAAKVQWARLAVRQAQSTQYNNALLLLRRVNNTEFDKKVLFLRAMVEWRLHNEEEALNLIQGLIPEHTSLEIATPTLISFGNAVTGILTEMAPRFWKKRDFIGFLVLCDRFHQAIQLSDQKDQLMLQVGKMYTESGMATSGARVLQKLLNGEERDKALQNKILLELARTYAILGERDLLEQTLKQFTDTPQESEEKSLYYFARAIDFALNDDFSGCAHQIDSLLKIGVKGNDLYRLGLQGAICARKAKELDLAENFIGILAVNDTLDIKSNSSFDALAEWRQKAFFEKINIRVTQGKNEEAIKLFEKASLKKNEVFPPVETVFLIIDAYRSEGEPDKAASVWQEYAKGKEGELPSSFVQSYSQVLDLLVKTELLPTKE